jgi:hypothetical protein
MSAEHLTDHDVEAYQQRSLGSGDLVRVTDHLAFCGDCQGRLGGDDIASVVAGIRKAFLAAPTEAWEHPSGEEIAAFVDGSLDEIDTALVRSHEEECAACAADIADLRKFRAGWTRSSGRRPRWIAAVASLASAAVLAWITLRPSPIAGGRPHPDRPGPTESAVVLSDVSGAITLDSHGNWSGWPALSEASDELVRRVLISNRLEIPADVLRLPGARGNLRGGVPEGPVPHLVYPVGVVVEEDRPVFRWQPIPGARRYGVTLAMDGGAPPMDSGPVLATEWTPPRALKRGQPYVWQLTVYAGSGSTTAPQPPEPEARFFVLDRQALESLEEARGRTSGSHLVMGILDARAGLLDDAEKELKAFAALNPTSPLPSKLLADFRAQRAQKPAPITPNAAQ